MRRRFASLVAAALWAASASTAWAADEVFFEIRFHGQKVGHIRGYDEAVERAGGPAVHAHRRSLITVKRLDETIRMEHRIDAWFRPDGTPLAYRVRRVEGGEVRTGLGRRDGDRFVIEQTVGGRTRTRAVELGPDVRLGTSLEWLHLRSPKAGARISGRVIDETEGDVQPFLLEVGRPGRDGFPVRERQGSIESVLLAREGEGVVRSELVGAGIVMTRVDRADALRIDAAVDIFSAALFPVDADLSRREALEAVVLRFTRDGSPLPAIAEFEGQEVVRRPDGSVQVTTSVPPRPKGGAALPVEDPAMAPFLTGTDYEDLDDPELVAAARGAIGDAEDAWAAARRLNRFVHRHLRDKTLAHAYASATEALAARAGDCTEHAVLFSALAKIVGIPTRLVTGLVYVGGARPAFGYHEWVEVWLGEAWHPMDPTFGQEVADATHVKFSQGLSNPEGLRRAGLAAASLIGDVTLEVEGIRVDGQRREAP